MKTTNLLALAGLLGLAACGAADVGEECTTDEDCAEGLECHVEEHDDHDDEEEHDEEEHEETGHCEEAGDDHDHE